MLEDSTSIEPDRPTCVEAIGGSQCDRKVPSSTTFGSGTSSSFTTNTAFSNNSTAR